jgi:hypothetical protein
MKEAARLLSGQPLSFITIPDHVILALWDLAWKRRYVVLFLARSAKNNTTYTIHHGKSHRTVIL